MITASASSITHPDDRDHVALNLEHLVLVGSLGLARSERAAGGLPWVATDPATDPISRSTSHQWGRAFRRHCNGRLRNSDLSLLT